MNTELFKYKFSWIKCLRIVKEFWSLTHAVFGLKVKIKQLNSFAKNTHEELFGTET